MKVTREEAERFLMNALDRILMTAKDDAGELTMRRIEEERSTVRAIIRNVRCCGDDAPKPRPESTVDLDGAAIPD